ncbi:DUF397 domain-containing protein [Streptomyces sp. Je 1-4]|uniref:DUF397 domain-containing protein n=1 Tax=Streptomyces TaxID=1883 RepID=UPI0021DAA71D|nr:MULTISPECIES: DUF397 domain-containing protein [unclassified Streptomyces]UYB40838.1 DUF397 domain-containing protein [Streptomyces sp. Je 1-4]UZQ36992.1 DUF397 domain-containing protein [Streptomyces sp. Je 1-4] [Streptomyces sp. Je 1-4 4N24]UZQ44409.1 DUF397 domain-containing protein [Streptomyces sp. Je 1-4] [Streptomyces sp. Je 1-4 4N24_ara]
MSTTPDLSAVEWVKSSYSQGNGGDCIEWAPAFAASGVVPVRDSKDPHGPSLTFETAAWSSFVTAVKGEEFPA